MDWGKIMFYFLRSSLGEKYKYIYRDGALKGIVQSECVSCGRTVSTFLYDDTQNHQLVVGGGNVFPDLLAYCGSGERLVLFSEKLINILKTKRITGINDCEPICLFNETKNGLILDSTSPQYYVVRLCGMIDYDYNAMFLKKKNKCEKCGQYDLNRKRLYPTYIDGNSWNGNDIGYLFSFPAMIVCTKEVKDLISCNKLIGVEFEEIKTKTQTNKRRGDGSVSCGGDN